ncbi:preprotein translocase subunit Sec61beta [Candidatus Woesearchaeota archaeon]|nr:preprotein translocase subunit Sec61beta [Candidatus Woesearchaeota archaeon]
MARSNRISMPSSGAGITRYFEDYKSKIEFQPGHIIIITIIVILLIGLLHIYGLNILNIL